MKSAIHIQKPRNRIYPRNCACLPRAASNYTRGRYTSTNYTHKERGIDQFRKGIARSLDTWPGWSWQLPTHAMAEKIANILIAERTRHGKTITVGKTGYTTLLNVVKAQTSILAPVYCTTCFMRRPEAFKRVVQPFALYYVWLLNVVCIHIEYIRQRIWDLQKTTYKAVFTSLGRLQPLLFLDLLRFSGLC